MTAARRCSRSGCGRSAVATLTYVYSDSTAVVGPLATVAEPHSYDLCEAHAVRLTVPRGWEVVRHVGEFPVPAPQPDDLEALADAVREAARVEVVAPVQVVVPGEPARDRAPVRSYGTPRGYPPGQGQPGAGQYGAGQYGAGQYGGRPANGSGARARRGHLRVVPTPVE